MIAITGITGHSGSFFLQQLIDNKYPGKLRCLVRETTDTSKLENSGLDIEIFCGNAKDVDDMLRFVEGAETVVHISGAWRSLVLLEAISRTESVKHTILVHTTGIYSKHRMAFQQYKDIEEEMQKYLDMGLNITILRPTMIFGDIAKDRNISKFIRMVGKFPIMPIIDGGRGLIQPVNARDLGQAYYKAMLHEKLPELNYNVSGQLEISMKDMLAAAGGFMGKKMHFISVPMFIGVFGAKCVRFLSRGRIDLVEKVLRMGEDRVFSHEAASRDFGYEPEDFMTGLEREVRQYMQEKG